MKAGVLKRSQMAPCTFRPKTIEAPAYVKRIAQTMRLLREHESEEAVDKAVEEKPRWVNWQLREAFTICVIFSLPFCALSRSCLLFVFLYLFFYLCLASFFVIHNMRFVTKRNAYVLSLFFFFLLSAFLSFPLLFLVLHSTVILCEEGGEPSRFLHGSVFFGWLARFFLLVDRPFYYLLVSLFK